MTPGGCFPPGPSPSTSEIKLIRGYHKGKKAAESQIETIVPPKEEL